MISSRPNRTLFIVRPSAHASVCADGSKIAISNLVSGFDMYALDTGASLGSLRNPVGVALRVIPVTFAQRDNVIVGGSSMGSAVVWDLNTRRVAQRLPVKGQSFVRIASI